MYIVYIDDSGDEVVSVFSALAIPAENWKESFDALKAYRQEIRNRFGVYMKKELHAWEFVSGRGKYGPELISIEDRCRMFFEAQKTAWFMTHRIRLAMQTGSFEKYGDKFDGAVEVDNLMPARKERTATLPTNLIEAIEYFSERGPQTSLEGRRRLQGTSGQDRSYRLQAA